MQLHLQGLQQNTNALRKQLSQLRNMQVCLHVAVSEKGLKPQFQFVYVFMTVYVCVCSWVFAVQSVANLSPQKQTVLQ